MLSRVVDQEAGLVTYDFTEPTDSLKDWSAANYCLMTLADPRSVEPVLELVEQIAHREGLGGLLADGVRSALTVLPVFAKPIRSRTLSNPAPPKRLATNVETSRPTT